RFYGNPIAGAGSHVRGGFIGVIYTRIRALSSVRFTLKSGHVQRTTSRLLWAKSGHRILFDHVIGLREQRRWHRYAQRLRSLEVDHQLVLGRRLYRKIGRLLAFENTIDVACGTTELIDRIRAV